ncbi:uncharacterized protein LY89DRAFT_740342 [Mollisia scopiformis]|uniref:Uncharacterized protein n=1 Tax=Mollisia scopiformis TaxID=149040 RepID=A0A132BBY0_MOLSC|nr:uncharacterized protein LY89DRAFT_740342 [Mollisia scopiformis]KUJ09930.1 hypothetical protein LY89DRAFT_740342 [Mollisia scopiformis]
MSSLSYHHDSDFSHYHEDACALFKDGREDAPMAYMDCKSNEQFQDNIEDPYDLDDQSEVPSMTRGSSSRSASSSIIICPTCENSSERCQCQQQPSRPYSKMEFASIISRANSPTVFAQSGQHERIKSLLQHGTSSSATPTVKSSSRALFLTPPPTIGWKSDVSPQSNYQADRVPNQRPDVFYNDQQTVSHNQNGDGLEESEDDEEISDSEEEVLSDQLTDFNDDLEALVLKTVGGDLELAAYLIPIFHKMQYTDQLANITQKVDSWHNALAINKCSPGTGAGQTPSSNARSPDGNGRAQKRRRGLGSDRPIKESQDEDPDDDEDDDDNQDSKGAGEDGEGGVNTELPRLACPFNKVDPIKYGIHGVTDNSGKSQYRICAGPGFANIQRLKEHLKRKHYPVQCDRCYMIFPGADRAVCVTNLEAHRQQINMCERREATLKEGISDAQWAQLDKKRSVKQVKSLSRVEKYWEIWEIIFPNTPKPKTPWYDDKAVSKTFAYSPESQRFGDIFSHMLDRQVLDQRIRFPDGLEQDMKARVSALAREAFSIFSRVHVQPLPSSSNSSSSRSHLQTNSYLSGSYTHISTPQSGGQRRASAARSAAPSQTFSLDNMQISTSPTESQGQSLRSQRAIMGPPPNSGSNMRLQQSYGTMQSQPSSVAGYQMGGLPMESFQYPNYGNNQPGPGSNSFYQGLFNPNFSSEATSYAGGAVATAFSDVPPPGMINAPDAGLQGTDHWDPLNFDNNLSG